MTLSPALASSLLKSNPSFQMSSSALGGTAEVGSSSSTTGTFNFGGSSMTPIILIGAGLLALFLLRHK